MVTFRDSTVLLFDEDKRLPGIDPPYPIILQLYVTYPSGVAGVTVGCIYKAMISQTNDRSSLVRDCVTGLAGFI
jgi:hypothetical protein